jgi:hypothetical protein
MTNQLLVGDRLTTSPLDLPSVSPAQVSSGAATSTLQPRTLEAMKTQYQLDQQVKFLSLQAEAELLIQQLQTLKQQRQLRTVSSSK